MHATLSVVPMSLYISTSSYIPLLLRQRWTYRTASTLSGAVFVYRDYGCIQWEIGEYCNIVNTTSLIRQNVTHSKHVIIYCHKIILFHRCSVVNKTLYLKMIMSYTTLWQSTYTTDIQCKVFNCNLSHVGDLHTFGCLFKTCWIITVV